jgi:inosine-uridine nucleoside N-ribohydrolase
MTVAEAVTRGELARRTYAITIGRVIEPVHVVVDGGLDGALALAALVGLNVPVSRVIATEGSVDLAITALATRRLMATLGSTDPVRLGSDRAIIGPYPGGRDPIHGADAFGGTSACLPLLARPSSMRPTLTGLCSALAH